MPDSQVDPTTISMSSAVGSPAHDPREWALEGVTNFRDLGGLMNRHGLTVRRERVFRSDNLARLTASDLERLAPLAIRTLIDFRTAGEADRSGPSQLLARGTRRVHAPVIDIDANLEELGRKSLAEMYAAFLTQGTSSYRRAFASLATSDDFPAVIHCAAGKDRTGVASALLLRLLEVDDATIVADYTLTDRNMARMFQSWIAADPERAADETLTIRAQLAQAPADAMQTFLVILDTTYGSAEAYLLAAGVTDAEIAAIRAHLLA
jgi:protein-tyrosine phosphatase